MQCIKYQEVARILSCKLTFHSKANFHKLSIFFNLDGLFLFACTFSLCSRFYTPSSVLWIYYVQKHVRTMVAVVHSHRILLTYHVDRMDRIYEGKKPQMDSVQLGATIMPLCHVTFCGARSARTKAAHCFCYDAMFTPKLVGCCQYACKRLAANCYFNRQLRFVYF